MSPPFDLDLGLYLEKNQLLLPWGSQIEKLCLVGDPEIYRHPRAVNIFWKDEIVFGGLSVQVSAMTAAGPNAFYLCRTEQAGSAHDEYSWLLHELTLRLGSPRSSIIDNGYPWTKWLWEEVGVSLRIAERFGDYVSFMVAKDIFRG